MKTISLILAIAISMSSRSQVTKVSLRASGLTCSMCSNSINKALKTIDYVLDVDADIKDYTFQVTFKPNARVDFDLIRKKVENAGFTVSGFVATIKFDNVPVLNSRSVMIEDKIFLIENIKASSINGIKDVRILDKGFVSIKEYKKFSSAVLPKNTYHASI